jgi:CheY-like chemotaxis protein
MPALRLLVVEDDADLRSLLRRGLDEEGFVVTTAVDGESALTAAQSNPDALVIDIGLPDADGRDVCQALRARGCDAPVLFLTARDAVTDRVSGFTAGGDDYGHIRRKRAVGPHTATCSGPDTIQGPSAASTSSPTTRVARRTSTA